jgi:DNA polymerase-1
MHNKSLIFIDAMALAYKGYFAFITRPLRTSKGEPTSAVYGFLSQLLRVLEEQKPDYIAIATDSKEKTFRHEKYPAYKSSRQVMPDDMIPQLQRINQIIEILKIPLYVVPGFEADDIIGTALTQAEKLDFNGFAVTPDKDYFQLITEKIKIIRPGKSTDEAIVYDEKRFKDEFGFEPKFMVDYLALIGDSSDDIPGVKGIGEKSAIPLIQRFGTIENIYANLDKIEKKAVQKKLEENRENAFLSKELATIHKDVPIKIDFESTVFELPNLEHLKEIFLELEFKTLYSKFIKLYDNSFSTKITVPEKLDEILTNKQKLDLSSVHYHQVKDEQDLLELKRLLTEKKLFVFDTETTDLNPWKAKLIACSFCVKPKEAFYIRIIDNRKFIDNQLNKFFNPESEYKSVEKLELEPEPELEHKPEIFPPNFKDLSSGIPLEMFAKLFKDVFEDESIKKVCQNGKFDISILRMVGINIKNFYFDTMLAAYVIDPDQSNGMDDLSRKYLNYSPIPITDLISDKKNPAEIEYADSDLLFQYSCEDADITFQLYEKLDSILKKENLEKVAYEIEFPLVQVLEKMEHDGVKIDKDVLQNLSKDLEILLLNYQQEIYRIVGQEFNINSPKQLQEILYDKLKLSAGRKTKTGFSTDARSLENLRGEHEVIDLILNYRQVSKLKSTYTDALPKMINPITNRLHTSFNQAVATTGRLASNDPNLQNIPIRTELGKEIRKAFVPRDKDYLIMSADYSQIELRIMASICEDENLIKAFKNNEDIHRSTAALVFNVEPEDVTPEMRRKAKEVNFGILYGIGPFGLKTRLGISQTHAKEIIDNYFNTFTKVKSYMDNAILKAQQKGYAETLLGRRRYLRNINSNNRNVKQFEERAAINMPIQGTAADMIKLAMIKIHNELEKMKAKTKMILQVHDELVFDVHKTEVDEMKEIIKNLMETAFPLKVPVVVDVGIGDNWLDAH